MDNKFHTLWFKFQVLVMQKSRRDKFNSFLLFSMWPLTWLHERDHTLIFTTALSLLVGTYCVSEPHPDTTLFSFMLGSRFCRDDDDDDGLHWVLLYF